MTPYCVKKRDDGRFCIYLRSVNMPVAVFEPGALSDAIALKTILDGNEDLLPAEPKKKAKGTLDEIRAYCQELELPESDGVWFYDKCEGCNWRNGSHKIADWKATVRSWKTNRYFPSQKLNGNGHYARPSAHQPPSTGSLNAGRY